MPFQLLAPQSAVDERGRRVFIVDRDTIGFKAPGFDVRAEAEYGSPSTVYIDSIVDINGRSLADSDLADIALAMSDGLIAMGVAVELVPDSMGNVGASSPDAPGAIRTSTRPLRSMGGPTPEASSERTAIEARSSDPARPFAHLLPLVSFLIEGGNAARTDPPFFKDVDGWRCDLERPIDFDGVRANLELPDSIRLSPGHDSILCVETWIEIAGPKS